MTGIEMLDYERRMGRVVMFFHYFSVVVMLWCLAGMVASALEDNQVWFVINYALVAVNLFMFLSNLKDVRRVRIVRLLVQEAVTG